MWGGIVFYILSTTPLPAAGDISIQASLQFTIYILSLGWLASSGIVKLGLTLKKKWIKVSIVSCVFFIFLLINMHLVQAGMQNEVSVPEDKSPYPYNLIASWFISWFWIDMFLLMSWFMRWISKKSMPS